MSTATRTMRRQNQKRATNGRSEIVVVIALAVLAAQGGIARNPHGPASSLDPSEPDQPKRVQRGGSFLCTDGISHSLHGRHTRQG